MAARHDLLICHGLLHEYVLGERQFELKLDVLLRLDFVSGPLTRDSLGQFTSDVLARFLKDRGVVRAK